MSVICSKEYTVQITGVSIPAPTAYWKMEEAANPRVNALGHPIDDFTVTNNCGRAAGKILFGMSHPDRFVTTHNPIWSYPLSGHGLSMVTWINFDSHPGGLLRENFGILGTAVGFTTTVDFVGAELRATFGYGETTGNVATLPFVFVLGTWYFIASVYDVDTGVIRVSVNAGVPAIIAAGPVTGVDTDSYSDNSIVGSGSVLIDEMGIWIGTALSPAEITALYNSGNGKTYPF